MAKGHTGKIALITGAARGIGQAYAMRLAEDGVDVVAVDLHAADETVQRVKAIGRRAFTHPCDVSDEKAVAGLHAAVMEHFGRIDILVNNAGIYPFKPFAGLSFAEWRKVMAVNLDSVFLMAHAFAPAMVERGWGRIVNQTSTSIAMVVPDATHYVASKMGVIGFTRALASELGEHGVTVNAIAPGATRTPGMVEAWGADLPVMAMAKAGQAIKRGEEPADLVGVLSFLTSDDAAFMTGQTLVVDGGMIRV